jgi:hypothetical protein
MNNAKIVLIVGTVALDKAIVSIHARGQKLQADMHRVACSVLSHAFEHGDIRPLAKLLQAMPESSRSNALRAWSEHFGPVRYDGKNPLFVKGRENQMAAAMAMPFWQFKPEEDYQPLDVIKSLNVLMKKLVTDGEKTERDHTAVITAIKGQIAALSAKGVAPAGAVAN